MLQLILWQLFVSFRRDVVENGVEIETTCFSAKWKFFFWILLFLWKRDVLKILSSMGMDSTEKNSKVCSFYILSESSIVQQRTHRFLEEKQWSDVSSRNWHRTMVCAWEPGCISSSGISASDWKAPASATFRKNRNSSYTSFIWSGLVPGFVVL